MSSLGLSFAETALSGALKSISPFSKEKNTGNINWGEYNYPPCLSLVHYDPDDIQNESVRKVVVMMNRVLQLAAIACVLNLFDTIIDATFYKDAKWQWVFYAILNILLIPPIGLYIFFQGYKGVALMDTSLIQKYTILGAIQSFFYFLFALIPFGAMNGLLSFSMYNVGIYWGVAIVIESGIWATAFGMCIYTVIYTARGDYNMLPVVTRVK